MRISVEQAIQGGESDCRNRLIHQMFLMIGLGERAGSGVPKIYSGWKSGQWRPPALYEKEEPEQTILELRMLDLLPREVVEQMRLKFGEHYDRLPHLPQLMLATAAIEGVVSHPRLLEISTDHPHDITLALQKLVKHGFLTTSGYGRGGAVYHFPRIKMATPDEVFSGGTSLDEMQGSEQRSEGLFAEGLEMPIIHQLSPLNPELLQKLQTIAAPTRSCKLIQKHEMEVTLVKLCKNRYLTLKVLGELLNRQM